jgi:hypothetical protein
MVLQTERLLIRTLAAEDAPATAAIWCDTDVTRFMGGPRDYQQTLQDQLSEAAESIADPRGERAMRPKRPEPCALSPPGSFGSPV